MKTGISSSDLATWAVFFAPRYGVRYVFFPSLYLCFSRAFSPFSSVSTLSICLLVQFLCYVGWGFGFLSEEDGINGGGFENL